MSAASSTRTVGGAPTAFLTVPVWGSRLLLTIFAATGATAVAEKVIGLPLSEPAVATRVCTPGIDPSTQRAGAAMPDAFVTADPPVTAPFPEPGEKMTLNPATGFPLASVTLTDGGVATGPPAVAVSLFPANGATVVGVPAPPVAVNVTEAGVSPAPPAVRVFGPAVVPSVQLPIVAIPDAFVVAAPPVIVPPPLATAKVIANPEIGFSNASVTFTPGGVATALPATAVCPSPATIARAVGGPGTTVTVALAVFPSEAAAIVDCPGRCVLARPLASIVTAAGLELVQVTTRLSGNPSTSLRVAVN